MTVHDLFSKRRRRAAGQMPDVFVYDQIPSALREQVVQILEDVFVEGARVDLYDYIVKALRREYGVKMLVKNYQPHNPAYSQEELEGFIRGVVSSEKALDAIELCIRSIDKVTRDTKYAGRMRAAALADAAIEEFNVRCREQGVGYAYEDGEIIRVDSALIHDQAVRPALVVLRQPEYASAQEEFLSAHEHYRRGRFHEALVDALKSFESTMKVICNKRGWAHDPRATASDLVTVCFTQGLIPPYWQTHFGGLRSVLTSGIPTPRNRQGGHGAGAQPVQEPPAELISYVLHMTASTILFLAEAEESLP